MNKNNWLPCKTHPQGSSTKTIIYSEPPLMSSLWNLVPILLACFYSHPKHKTKCGGLRNHWHDSEAHHNTSAKPLLLYNHWINKHAPFRKWFRAELLVFPTTQGCFLHFTPFLKRCIKHRKRQHFVFSLVLFTNSCHQWWDSHVMDVYTHWVVLPLISKPSERVLTGFEYHSICRM